MCVRRLHKIWANIQIGQAQNPKWSKWYSQLFVSSRKKSLKKNDNIEIPWFYFMQKFHIINLWCRRCMCKSWRYQVLLFINNWTLNVRYVCALSGHDLRTVFSLVSACLECTLSDVRMQRYAWQNWDKQRSNETPYKMETHQNTNHEGQNLVSMWFCWIWFDRCIHWLIDSLLHGSMDVRNAIEPNIASGSGVYHHE